MMQEPRLKMGNNNNDLTIDMERAVLSSVLHAEMFDECRGIQSVDLDRDVFAFGFHKNVVDVINALRDKKRRTDDLTVHLVMQRNRIDNEESFLSILSANPFSSLDMFKHYVSQLHEETVKSQWTRL